ncbi:MAG: endonuclease/exonuclease/phosphatase family protein [Bacteriovoracaceae bacterium]|nr:endonuclease/exonuclease/phosphatase family protein [Bacteriovoracaceae bacterium]
MKYMTILLFVALSAHAFKAGTFNIRNFDKSGSSTNKVLLEQMIEDMDADLLAVQEILNHRSFRSFVESKLEAYELVLSNCGGGGGQKLGFLYKRSALKLISVEEDKRVSQALSRTGCGSLRPALVAIFEDNNSKRLGAISLHLKAGGGKRNISRRATQYKSVSSIIFDLEDKGIDRIVAMGDFNTTGYDLKNADYHNFLNLLSRTQSTTTAEAIECTSYWKGKSYSDGIEEASTLDHIVYSKSFGTPKSISVGSHCEKVGCRDVYEEQLGESYKSVSDHCPVSATF